MTLLNDQYLRIVNHARPSSPETRRNRTSGRQPQEGADGVAPVGFFLSSPLGLFVAASRRTSDLHNPYRLVGSPGMICRSGAGPIEIWPVNGRSCAATSSTEAATPVANSPIAIPDPSRLSQ